jgi:hypothetical protein
MLLERVLAEGMQIDWGGVAMTIAALVVGWVLLKFVLRLTLKVFACGGIILLALAGIGFAVVYWDQIAVWFQ